jgi:hypothetical protein
MAAVAGLARASAIRSLTPSNPQMVNRVVGFLEYGRALALFDRLLDTTTPSELEVMDSLVRQRDEFAVYTNLSRRMELEPSSLSEPKAADINGGPKRGLAWIIALARVELGAMSAGFTDQPNPFSATRPSRLELSAYNEILTDGMRSHYWTLRSDQTAQSLAFQTEPQAIAYARRVTVAIEFLRASRRFNEDRLTFEQRLELDAWEIELVQVQRTILYGVLRLDDPATIALKQSMFQDGCGRLLATAKKELPATKVTTPTTSQSAGPPKISASPKKP